MRKSLWADQLGNGIEQAWAGAEPEHGWAKVDGRVLCDATLWQREIERLVVLRADIVEHAGQAPREG